MTAWKAEPSFANVTDENTPARFPSERAGEDFSALTRDEFSASFPFLLPLWEKVARTQSVPDEGFFSADEGF